LGNKRKVLAAVAVAAIWVCGTCPTTFAAAGSGDAPASRRPSATSRKLEVLIRDLYRLHNKGYGPIFDVKGRKYLRQYFERPLADLLEKNIVGPPSGEVGNLDFDPLFFAQDLGLSDFRVAPATVRENDARSVVTFKNYGRKTTIVFRLRRTREGWKIRDLDYGNGETLVRLLSKPF
jgi:hypothetical protein